MASKCSLLNKSNVKKVEAINTRLIGGVDDLVKVMTALGTADKSLNSLNVETAKESAEALLTELVGQRTTIEDLKNFTDERKAVLFDVMQKTAKEAYRALDNPTEVLGNMTRGSMIYKAFKHEKRIQITDTLMEGMWNRLLRLTGLDPTDNIGFDIIGQKLNKVEHFEPARKAFALHQYIAEYMQKTSRILQNSIKKEFHALVEESSIKALGLDTADAVSKMLPLFDSNINTSMKKHYGVNSDMELISRHAEKLGIAINEDYLDASINAFEQFRNRFNQINYGDVSDDDWKSTDGNIKIYEKAPDMSILGFIRNTSSLLNRAFSMLDDTKGINQSFKAEYEAIRGYLKDFKPRRNYLPTFTKGNLDSDPLAELYRHSDENKKTAVSSFLKARGLVDAEDTETHKFDFLDAMVNNFSGLTLMAEDVSNKFFHFYVEGQLKANSKWFSTPERLTIRDSIKQMSTIAQMRFTRDIYRGAFKNISSALTIIPTSILMLPGSAIKNTLAGMLNLYWKMGSEIRGGDYRAELSSGNDNARIVDDYTRKYLMSVGLVSEYTEYAAKYREGLDDAFSELGKFSLKISDVISDGFGLGMISETWHKFLTMGGTEDGLRAHAGNILYNRLQKYALLKGKKSVASLDKGDVIRFIEANKDNVFYDVNNALGNFTSMNKPFFTHALAETAETRTQLLAGLGMKFVSMFRHAGVVTAQNFTRSFVDMTFKESNPVSQPKEKAFMAAQAGLLVGGLLFAMYEILKETVFSESSDFPKVNMSISSAINPYEEVDIAGKWIAYLTLGAFFNMPMSDEDYQSLKRETSRTFLGMFAPGGVGGVAAIKSPDMTEVESLLEDMLDIRMNFFNMVTTDYTTDEEGWKAMRDLRAATRESREEVASVMQLDPIWVIHRLIAIAKVNAPNDRAAEWRVRSDLISQGLSTMFGMNFWISNQPKPTEYYGSDQYLANDAIKYESMIRKLRSMGYKANADMGDRIIGYYQKFGRMPKDLTRMVRR